MSVDSEPTVRRAAVDGPEVGRHLSVVIPAYNEPEGLPLALRALVAMLPAAEIIVVDDGSSASTAQAAAPFAGVTIIRHPFNRGYGGALKTGMRHATREFVAWFDADNEHRASDLHQMLLRISAGDCAAVIAQRSKSGPSPMREWGKAAIGLLARSFVNMGSDINCGLRVFRRDVITQYLPVLPDGYSASITSTMVMLERGYPVAFHPVEVNPRSGESKVKIGDGFMALMLVLRTIMLFGPLRVFLSIGTVLSVGGLIYGITLALRHGLGVPTGAVLLVLTGVLLSMFGLVADQISQFRLTHYDEAPLEWVRDSRAPQQPGHERGKRS